MQAWFLRDPSRLRLELDRVTELSREAEWLRGYEWLFDRGELCLDAILRAHEIDYEIRVSFPPLFPEVPLVVRPRNAEARWSAHQYGGADGPLCLEWGPDNWRADITAVEMLKSAHRLLEMENPLGVDPVEVPQVAPSRHSLTPGQELRGSFLRWYCQSDLARYLGTVAERFGQVRLLLRGAGESEMVAIVKDLLSRDEVVWSDGAIPRQFHRDDKSDLLWGVWFQSVADPSEIERADSLERLLKLAPADLGAELLATNESPAVGAEGRRLDGVLVRDGAGGLHCFITLTTGSALRAARIVSNQVSVGARAPSYERLRKSGVGIVGLGSVGSKVAIALARMGVGRFYLVDFDLFLPENVARHALDWQGVARHKVDAVRTALALVSPSAEVEVSRIHLTGQESNAAVSHVLGNLGECDLIVDATANPRVFNLLAAAARAKARAMVWVEVFAGGIGGLVARSRPAAEPSPQLMRAQFLGFCEENPRPIPRAEEADYAGRVGDETVLIASDADVGILASLATSLIDDTLAPVEESKYPHSMYLVGLSREWIFRQPLEVIPIETSSPKPHENQSAGGDLSAEDLELIARLLGKSPS